MATDNSTNGTSGGAESPLDSARKAFGETAASFTEQAGAKARDYTAQGKDRAVEALDNVASLVGDAASQVSAKLGDQYGSYIQQAADAVNGLASTLRDKDPDDLFDDARNVVRSSPAIAIAAAAAVGFLVARVVKSGLSPAADSDVPVATPAAKPAAKPRAPRKPAAAAAAAKASPTPPTATAASEDTPPAA